MIEQGLAAAVIDQPADSTTKLILADWLDEHDQPELAERVREAANTTTLTEFLAAIGLVKVEIVFDDRSPRRRTRIVSIEEQIAKCAAALWSGEYSRRYWIAKHGGTVANAYRYPAYTDAVAVVGWRAEDGVIQIRAWATQISAKGATASGVLRATCGHHEIADDRYGDERKRVALDALLEELQQPVNN